MDQTGSLSQLLRPGRADMAKRSDHPRRQAEPRPIENILGDKVDRRHLDDREQFRARLRRRLANERLWGIGTEDEQLSLDLPERSS